MEVHYVKLKVNDVDTIEIEFTFLEDFVTGHSSSDFDSTDEFIENYKYSDAQEAFEAFKKHKYSVQYYVVHFDTNTPVNVSVDVYHQNQTALSKKEIMEEAIGYLADLRLDFKEKDAFAIEAKKLELR